MFFRQSKTYKKVLMALATAATVFVVSLFIAHTQPFRYMELVVTDQLFEIRGPADLDDSPVVLVAISQQAESQIPQGWPWPRDVFAHLVDNLGKAGASVVGFDVTFEQQDRYDPQNDTTFAASMAEHENVVLLGDMRRDANLHQVIPPYELFNQSNPNPYGLGTVYYDIDGGLRRYRLSRAHMDSTYLTFGLELIRKHEGWDASVELEDKGDHFKFGDYLMPKYDQHSIKINYHGGPGSFTEFHFDQVIDDANYLTVDDREIWGYESVDEKEYGIFDDPDPEFGLLHTGDLEDKIVIVGATIPDLHDFHTTPFATDGTMPGYEMHANAIQTILSGDHIRSAGFGLNTLVLFGASVVTALIIVFATPLWGLLLVALKVIGIGIGTVYLFAYQSFSIELIPPVMAVVFGYVGAQTYNYFMIRKEKTRIQNMFGSYVSPALVNKMVESEEEPKLGGDEVYITAFFSDIQSFTEFSELLSPTQLVELINEYLSGLTDVLTDRGGTLDKYVGDAVAAIFGAPVPMEDHAYRACITSQHMLMKQEELKKKWRNETDKWPEKIANIRTRIGINTGWMVTGNMGSTRRFNYTMMGDNVNIAARCESASKEYGIATMVTEDTKNEAERYGDECVFRYLDKIVVTGKTKPINVYEIMGLKSWLSDENYECLRLYNEGIKMYQDREWRNAIEVFEESQKYEQLLPSGENNQKINPSLVMAKRCREMLINPPGEEWDGVFRMKSK